MFQCYSLRSSHPRQQVDSLLLSTWKVLKLHEESGICLFCQVLTHCVCSSEISFCSGFMCKALFLAPDMLTVTTKPKNY